MTDPPLTARVLALAEEHANRLPIHLGGVVAPFEHLRRRRPDHPGDAEALREVLAVLFDDENDAALRLLFADVLDLLDTEPHYIEVLAPRLANRLADAVVADEAADRARLRDHLTRTTPPPTEGTT